MTFGFVVLELKSRNKFDRLTIFIKEIDEMATKRVAVKGDDNEAEEQSPPPGKGEFGVLISSVWARDEVD